MKLREIEFVETDRENSYEVYVGDFRVGYFTYMPMLDSYSFIPNFELVYNLQRVNYNSKESFVKTLSEYLEKQYEQSDSFRNRLFDDKKELFFEEIYIYDLLDDYVSIGEEKESLSWTGYNVKINKENDKYNLYIEKVYRPLLLWDSDNNIEKVQKSFKNPKFDESLIYHKPFNKFLHKITFGLVKLGSYLPKDTKINVLLYENLTIYPKFLTINGETF